MGLFSRKTRRLPPSLIPPQELASLSGLGQSTFRMGERPDVSGYYLPGLLEAGSPSPGSKAWDDFVDQFLSELLTAADAQGGWAYAGALAVAKDFVGGSDALSIPLFAAIADRALPFMATHDVAGADIPNFLMDRWIQAKNETG